LADSLKVCIRMPKLEATGDGRLGDEEVWQGDKGACAPHLIPDPSRSLPNRLVERDFRQGGENLRKVFERTIVPCSNQQFRYDDLARPNTLAL